MQLGRQKNFLTLVLACGGLSDEKGLALDLAEGLDKSCRSVNYSTAHRNPLRNAGWGIRFAFPVSCRRAENPKQLE